MINVLKVGILFLGLLFGTPFAHSMCMAMNQRHDSSMQHCADDTAPRDSSDMPTGCCVGAILTTTCDTTLGSCCSLSQQKVPAKTPNKPAPVTALLRRANLLAAPWSVKYRHDQTPDLVQAPPSDRQAILSSFLI